MKDPIKHYAVNWIDGMKINKDHFQKQDNAFLNAMQNGNALSLSPIRYGVIPSSAAGESAFNVKISLDNQASIRAYVIACQAITQGGAYINLPGLVGSGISSSDGVSSTSFQFTNNNADSLYWVVLTINPYEKQPAGSPDTSENPPRFPSVVPSYHLEIITNTQLKQFIQHPYTIIVGKINVNGSDIRVDENYIPPCISISAHPDLISLHAEIDQFFSNIEVRCSSIVQKIFKKSQQNELSDLVLFLCDRMILFLSQVITQVRWNMLHASPSELFASVAGMSRLMKNTIDLRIGSGKDELLNYFSEWCELNQGELESMLSGMAVMRYNHNDINENINQISKFVRITGKLFEVLSNLEFIGKRKESGIFVKEEVIQQPDQNTVKAKRRFFGG